MHQFKHNQIHLHLWQLHALYVSHQLHQVNKTDKNKLISSDAKFSLRPLYGALMPAPIRRKNFYRFIFLTTYISEFSSGYLYEQTRPNVHRHVPLVNRKASVMLRIKQSLKLWAFMNQEVGGSPTLFMPLVISGTLQRRLELRRRHGGSLTGRTSCSGPWRGPAGAGTA